MYEVRTGSADGRAHHWWASFLARGIPVGTERYEIQHWLDYHQSRARINPSGYRIGDIVEFESEKDFVMFVLRWS